VAPSPRKSPRNLPVEEENAREFSHVMTIVLVVAIGLLGFMLFTGRIWSGLRLWIYVGVVLAIIWALARERLGWLEDQATMRERRQRGRARRGGVVPHTRAEGPPSVPADPAPTSNPEARR
jgi:hypothetical protein